MNRQGFVGAPCAFTSKACAVAAAIRRIAGLAAIAGIMAISPLASAQTPPTVVTDLPDYPPGSTVHITGSGFTGSPVIVLQVEHVPEIPDDQSCDPFAHEP